VSKLASLLVFLAITAAAASIGALFMPGVWYAGLAKPAWTPPNSVFPIVWPILYVLIAISGWLVWLAAGWSAALLIWFLQLALNASWSWWMFGQHHIFAALVTIAGIWLAITAYVIAAQRWSRAAAVLFLPYWAWVTFAAALNFAVWRLNT
jgi:tryptophan-rich sensory protein